MHVPTGLFHFCLKSNRTPSPPRVCAASRGYGFRRSDTSSAASLHTASVVSTIFLNSFARYACAAIHSMEQATGHSQHAAIAPTSSEKTGPSATEWERVKPIVRRLYREERRPLRDVVVILDRDFGFRATYVSHHFQNDRPETKTRGQRTHV
jgi:hypothetical protein